MMKARRMVLAATMLGMWMVLGGVAPGGAPAGTGAKAQGKKPGAATPAGGGGCGGKAGAVTAVAPQAAQSAEQLFKASSDAYKLIQEKNKKEANRIDANAKTRHEKEDRAREWAGKFDKAEHEKANLARRKQADYLFTQSTKKNPKGTTAKAIATELARKNPGLKAEFDKIANEWTDWQVGRPPPTPLRPK